MVLEEPPVLGSDERFLHVIGNVGERHPDAAVAGFEHVGEIAALAVEHGTQARQLPALEPRLVRQIGCRGIEELDHLAEVDDWIGDVLVLAELAIGGVQVGEVDAVKGLDVAADHFRVVKRGGDEAVEVDRLDIEGRPHVGAAVAQNLHHLGTVLPDVKVRLHRLRLGRHLAQRQRGGKDLDQNQVHGGTRGQPSLRDITTSNVEYSYPILTKGLFYGSFVPRPRMRL